MNRTEAGRLGGLTVKALYGREFYGAIGSMGGRPRAKYVQEGGEARAVRAKNEGGKAAHLTSLTSLRRAWAKGL